MNVQLHQRSAATSCLTLWAQWAYVTIWKKNTHMPHFVKIELCVQPASLTIADFGGIFKISRIRTVADTHVRIIASSNDEIQETRCNVFFPVIFVDCDCVCRDILLATYLALSAIVSIIKHILQRRNIGSYANDLRYHIFLCILTPLFTSDAWA